MSTFATVTALVGQWSTHDPGIETSVVIQNTGHAPVGYRTGAATPAIGDPHLALLPGEDRQIEFDPGEKIHVISLGTYPSPVSIAY